MDDSLLSQMLQIGITKKEAWKKQASRIERVVTTQNAKVVSINNSTHNSTSRINAPILKTYVEAKHKVTKGFFDNLKTSTLPKDNKDLVTETNERVMDTPLVTFDTTSIVTPRTAAITPSPTVGIQFGNYEWDYTMGALYYRKSNDKRTEIANFALTIQRVIEIRDSLEYPGETKYHIVITHAQGYIKRVLSESRYKAELTKIGETINPIFNIVHKALFDRYLSDVVAQYWTHSGQKHLELSIHGWICSSSHYIYQYAFNNTYIQRPNWVASTLPMM